MALKPLISQLLLSPKLQKIREDLQEKRRKKAKQPHTLQVFIAVNCPHSYLLLKQLPYFVEHYGVTLDIRTVLDKQQDMYPAPKLWDSNAFKDAQALAKHYQIDFPQHPPTHSKLQIQQATAQLLHYELKSDSFAQISALFDSFWLADAAALNRHISPAVKRNYECYSHHLLHNQHHQKQLGHYLTGNIFYQGDWFWSINRLCHLEHRLNRIILKKQSPVRYNHKQLQFAEANIAAGESITLFWSLRSPYSYLMLLQANKLAQHYGIELIVKPVLPMVMRRMQVPKNKKFYIALDTQREALRQGIEFGKVADPLGVGIERVYALYQWAQSHDLGIELLLSAATGAWSQGLDCAKDNHLKIIVKRAGLDWHQATRILNNQDWRNWAQDNLEQLYQHDQWGVPCINYQGQTLFGQDQLYRIEQQIIDSSISKKEAQ
ncbi:DsbA family protein [Paraferrimonas sp. SM1919]|uniref:DsbA family protein n=1 Tax=Paraferrimonas sp. SM1919 TaxID=2662263 RepID=UPI0013D0A529|nr:DsbA family protein [Paraferrimonas sp. SM1919]